MPVGLALWLPSGQFGAPMAKDASEKKPSGDRVVGRNKRAYFDYEVGDTFEAGLSLIGSEARSLRCACR